MDSDFYSLIVLIWIIVAVAGSSMSKEKGYGWLEGFLVSLFFGFTGYLYFIGAPDKVARDQRDILISLLSDKTSTGKGH